MIVLRNRPICSKICAYLIRMNLEVVYVVWDMLPEGTVETGGVTAAPGVWAVTGVLGSSSDGDAAVGTDGVAGSAVGPDESVKFKIWLII